MNIRSALDRIIAVQAAITIASPELYDVKKAYKYFPDQKVVLPDTPCFMNSWSAAPVERRSGLRTQKFTVHSQFFTGLTDQEKAADVASAFWGAIVTAFDADVTLEGAVTTHTLRGGNPTLVLLERGGLSCLGLDFYLDLLMAEAATFAP